MKMISGFCFCFFRKNQFTLTASLSRVLTAFLLFGVLLVQIFLIVSGTPWLQNQTGPNSCAWAMEGLPWEQPGWPEPTPRLPPSLGWAANEVEGFPPREARARGAVGAPLPGAGLSGARLQHFLCHRAPAAKVNISFEIKWKPQEVFFLILEKEINKTVAVLGQAVLFLHAQICTGRV